MNPPHHTTEFLIKDSMVKLISSSDDELIGEKIQLLIHDRRTSVFLTGIEFVFPSDALRYPLYTQSSLKTKNPIINWKKSVWLFRCQQSEKSSS